jgi:formiminotetrahydrofolate cyclodeaminase
MEFQEQQIGTYLETLASKAAVPGGGGVSALTGALAAGLAQMVCSLTVGKKRYADVEQEICETADALECLRERLVLCMQEDALAFEPLSKAYGLPKDTEEQKTQREIIMEECLVRAAQPPLHICEAVAELVPLICTAAEKGSRLAISDAGCAAVLAIAALKAAALNVTVNTRLMKNREMAAQLDAQVDALLADVPGQLEKVYTQVNADLRGL